MPRTIALVANTGFFAWVIAGHRARLLRERGHRVVIVAPLGRFRAPLESMGLETIDVAIPRGLAPLADAAAFVRLVAAFRRLRPHVVNTFTSKAGALGRAAARVAGVPAIVHTMQGLPFYEGQHPVTRRLYSAFERIGARFGDALFSENREDLHAARALGLAKGRRLHFVGSGLAVEELDARLAAADPAAARAALGLPEDAAVVLVPARLERVKGHAVLLDALAETMRRTPVPFVALLAGEGPLRAALEARAAELGLAGRVRFLGYVDDVPALLRVADIVALASEKEGIPRALLEAMLARRPVVATNVLGTRETVASGVTGFLSARGDAAAMAQYLAFLLEHPQAGRRLGAAGRARVLERHRERRVVERMEELYEAILREGGAQAA